MPGLGRFPWRRAWQPPPGFLLGESPWTEEPGRLQVMGSQRVRHGWEAEHTVALHFCVSFSVSTAEGISLSYTRIPSFLDFPPIVANRRR